MGQKVNPHGLRVGVIKDWDSRWYAREDKVGELIVEDYKIREYLKKTLYSAGVPTIEIERDSAKVRIYIHCSRPGVVIGKGGQEIERLRLEVEKLSGQAKENAKKNIDAYFTFLSKEKKEAAAHFANLYVQGTYPKAAAFMACECQVLTMSMVLYVKSIR